jgi:hypothetical protein
MHIIKYTLNKNSDYCLYFSIIVRIFAIKKQKR